MGRKKKNQQIEAKTQPIKQTPETAIDAFNGFIDSFIKGESYVLESPNSVFSNKDDVNNTFKLFCDNSQETKDEKTKDKIFNEVFKALAKEKDTFIDILNHAIWLWALPNDRKTFWAIKGQTNRYKDDLLKIKGVAGGGSGYVQKKTNGVRFILYLFTQIYGKKREDAVRAIIDTCTKMEYPKSQETDSSETYKSPDGVKNLLMHLCSPDMYQSIASTDDKKKIVRTFWDKIEDSSKPSSKKDALNDIDKTLNAIKESLCKVNGNDFSFYKSPFPLLLWKGEKETDLSLAQQLEYKKAMILYGPPGTSKTYNATELAKEIILRHVIKQDKKRALSLLNGVDNKKLDELINERIRYLQFHININYEDFIAGQTIKDQNVITKKGFIYDVIDKAESDFRIKSISIKNTPYVVILDEINRTDISRVFGELFTAIEKRGKEVDLLLPDSDTPSVKLKLNIPENVYFIGTMNEIDFSLERVDFALRRRFIWELHDYDKDSLESIINYKLDDEANYKYVDFNKDGIDLNAYCETCNKLNKKVEEVMSEAYHIGHTFFAEIVDIYIKLKQSDTTVQKPWEKAKKILWHISIRPTLEAYCGTMEKAERTNTISLFEGIFNK